MTKNTADVRSRTWKSAAGYNVNVLFFSSRRRHTRFDCDWSSDVCSSDLTVDQRDLSRADDEPTRRFADELAQAPRAERVREDLGIAVRAIVDEQDERLGPLAIDRKSVV